MKQALGLRWMIVLLVLLLVGSPSFAWDQLVVSVDDAVSVQLVRSGWELEDADLFVGQLAQVLQALGAVVQVQEEDEHLEVLSPYALLLASLAENSMYMWAAADVLPMVVGDACLVLDVRSPELRGRSLIDGSMHIPLRDLWQRNTEIPRDKPLAVYGEDDITAGYGAALLRVLGAEAYVLKNGINAWITAGGRVIFFST